MFIFFHTNTQWVVNKQQQQQHWSASWGRSSAHLNATLGLHQLQLGLRQLQLQLPQLPLQLVLLLVQRLRGRLVPAGGGRLEGARRAEQVPAALAALHFTLQGSNAQTQRKLARNVKLKGGTRAKE